MKQSSAKGTPAGLVLALEASSRTYAVAVGDGETPSARAAAGRDDPAFPELGELVAATLARAGVAFGDIGVIGVDVGPGGLSSIRTAVAYANGLAFALGVKIFPISSLELMAIEARQAHQGPVLSLKRGQGGNIYAGLFADGESPEMRHGLPGSVVPALAAGLVRLRVAGAYWGDVTGVLPGVAVTDSGIAEADVAVLYQQSRAAVADPERLVPVASPINEASRIFHKPVTSHDMRRTCDKA
jgi:tRNA threonylcarbamoyl adenosine modification protein YeaZ